MPVIIIERVDIHRISVAGPTYALSVEIYLSPKIIHAMFNVHVYVSHR